MSKSDDFVMFQCGDHARATYMGCLTCDQRKDQEVDRLRRDLATRDRELADALSIADEYEGARNQARAALAEKDEECRRLRAELSVTEQKHKVACEDAVKCGDLAASRLAKLAEKEREVADAGATCSFLTTENHRLNAKLAAAQEEAKGLRAWLAETATSGCEGGDEHNGCGDVCVGHEPCDCWPHRAARRLAARQQQPDGKPDPAPVASVTCAVCGGDAPVRPVCRERRCPPDCSRCHCAGIHRAARKD